MDISSASLYRDIDEIKYHFDEELEEREAGEWPALRSQPIQFNHSDD
jgi:hypothetical protein